MNKEEFRKVFLPYCLDRQPDGRYAVLNRRYKPVGMTVDPGAWVTYADHPCLVTLKGLTPLRAAKLSPRGDGTPARVYLYDDGCVPTASAADWAAYSQRLQTIAKLTIEY